MTIASELYNANFNYSETLFMAIHEAKNIRNNDDKFAHRIIVTFEDKSVLSFTTNTVCLRFNYNGIPA